MRVFIYTLGCRLNQCESEAIADSFKANGWDVVKESKDAELIIVNTCAVTSKAEQKARRMILFISRNSWIKKINTPSISEEIMIRLMLK